MKEKIKVLMVCHGNICRSTMAEFVMKHIVRKAGKEHLFWIASAATSREEIGNPVHPGTKRKLASVGIPVEPHCAVQMTKADYDQYDYIIGMDSWNMKNILRITGGDPEHKLYKLLDFTRRKGQDIADPWYTGNFDETYQDVEEGCRGLFQYLTSSREN